MAGNRITGGFKSYNGTEYDIFVYDADFVASLSTNPNVFGWESGGQGNAWGWESGGQGNVWGWDALDDLENPPGIQTHIVGLPGFTLEYETQNERVFSPLVPSRLSFKMVFEDAIQETFLNALANSYEGQFLVRVTRTLPGGSAELFWSGVLIPDVVQYEDQDYPYEFEFVAIDGLSRLSAVEYPASLVGNTKETLKEIIFECLSNLETNGFYGAADEYFVNNADWWDSLHQSAIAGADPLNLTRIKSGVLYEKDPTGEDFEFLSCFKVLEQVALAFGARVFQANGRWWFLQVTEQRISGQYERIYSKSGTLLSAINGISYDLLCNQTTLARAKGRYEFTPPLKKCVVTYKHRSNIGSLLTGAQWTWQTDGTNYEVGEVSYNDGAAKMRLYIELEHTWRQIPLEDMPNPDRATHYFRIQLQVGSYYYVGDDDDEAEWTTTPGYYIVATNAARQWENYITYIDITTAALPESGDCEISFEYLESDITLVGIDELPLGAGIPGLQYWTQYSPLLVVLADGNNTETVDFHKYTAANANTTNTKTEDITLYFGDGPYPSSPSKMEVWNGSAWVDSSGLWGAGGLGPRNDKLLEFLASQIVETQQTPRLKYHGTLITATGGSHFHAYNRLKIGTKYFIFLGGSFEANQDEWTNVTLFYVGTGADDPVDAEEEPIGVLMGE